MGKMKDIATMLAEYHDALKNHGLGHQTTKDIAAELIALDCDFVLDEMIAMEYVYMDEFYNEFG